jgi:hypothetical protein
VAPYMTPLTASTCAWTCTILFPGRDACAPKGGILQVGGEGGAGRRAKLSRVQHNANTGHPSTVAAFAWTEAWPAQPYGHAHDDFFSTATKPPHDPLGLDVIGTEDGSEDCSDEHIQRLRLRGCARTAECPRARSQKAVAKQGRHLEGGSN